jgi:hypothetical protein
MQSLLYEYNGNTEYGSDNDHHTIYIAIIALLIIVEISKEPEYICEFCGQKYKQETRYNSHIKKAHHQPCLPVNQDMCVEKDTSIPNSNIIMELLRQNRDMIDMLKQQQDTISFLLRHNKIIVD